MSQDRPQTRYAWSDDVSIAYQVLGEGDRDIVFVPGFPSHLDHSWEHPRLSYFYRRLGALGRLVLVDKRGVGMSDRVSPEQLPGIEQRKDDVLAVLDAVGIDQAVLIGASDGGPLALYFAAAYPRRTSQVVAINTYAKRTVVDGYPWAMSSEQWNMFMEEVGRHWGEPIFADIIAPEHANDEEFLDWWGSFMRNSMSPGAALAMMKMNAEIDIREILSAIHVPTLVIHRTGDQVCPVGGGRYIASRIEDSRFVELPGVDHLPWLGDAESVLASIEDFIGGQTPGPAPQTSLATIVFTDVVESTKAVADLGDRKWRSFLETLYDVIGSQVAQFGGRIIKTTGDGMLSVFDGPARALSCSLAVRDRLRSLDTQMRTGIHTSEVEFAGDDVVGVGVHIAARLMAAASPGQIVVSGVVRDLAFGSGFEFGDEAERELKGIPGMWRTFSLESATGAVS
ncbi:MAG: adenylate/guanylate cyclase domain-containing protein [Actinomycetota bacterium]